MGAHSYRFDVVCDYGAFRDLQRHRPLTIEWQRLTPELGYDVPAEIDDAGLAAEWDRVDGGGSGPRAGAPRGGTARMPRSTPSSMAYRIRFVMQMTAREAMHLTELRSQPQGHPTYRRVAQAMHRAIAERAPGDRRGVHLHERRGRGPRAPRGGAPHRSEAGIVAVDGACRPGNLAG